MPQLVPLKEISTHRPALEIKRRDSKENRRAGQRTIGNGSAKPTRGNKIARLANYRHLGKDDEPCELRC
jgi:hypothetical protein